MNGDRFRHQHILEGGAFARDLEGAVLIAPLVLVIKIDEQRLHPRVFIHDFLGQEEQAARQEPVRNTLNDLVTALTGDELEGVIHDDEGRVADRRFAQICKLQIDRRAARVRRFVFRQQPLAALDHRRGIIDGHDPAVRRPYALAHRERRRAEGTAEVVAAAAGRDEAGGERADGLEGRRVTGDRAPEHVGKHPRHGFVEPERLIAPGFGGKDSVFTHWAIVGQSAFPMLRDLHQELGIPADYGREGGPPLFEEAAELVDVGPNLVGRMQRLTPLAAARWAEMSAAAAADGIILLLVSGFRSVDYQAGLIRNKLERGQAIEAILKVNAAPGYSEHHTGQAVDIATPGSRPLTEEFEGTPAFGWLTREAARFGFSMSYPRDNPFGLIYEPWHWSIRQAPAPIGPNGG